MLGRFFAGGMLALAAAAPASASPIPKGELRGLWVVRTALVSPEAVDRVVDEAEEAGLNALFVQVRGRGDAFYRSSLAPRSPLLERQPQKFDPLKHLIARARARRLQVHAWVNVLLAAHFGQPLPDGHVLEKHPEWAMVPKSQATAALVASGQRRLQLIAAAGRAEGDVEGYYLTPAAPGVPEHLEAVVREIVRAYPVDGLHLDFIRYPGPTFDYSKAMLEGFRQRTGGGDLLAQPAAHPAEWDAYRRELLTALTTRLADAARQERPGLVLSAAVAPDEAQAVNNKFQDWPRWLATGVLQALCPMTYTPDSRLFSMQLAAVRERTGPIPPLWAGIAAYRLDVAGIVEKVTLARQAGAQGVVLFSHESLAPQDLRPLRDGAFGRQLVSAPGALAGGGAVGSR
ncbi:MAG TPA: family 10 glycosylhydrolase [Vicinamibacteria bacterium]